MSEKDYISKYQKPPRNIYTPDNKWKSEDLPKLLPET
jgi:hypothetical protein